jgi:Arc/MetJ-type ribon-helix-helix transcriptional regulator
MKTTVSFSLDTEEDADIVRWLKRQRGRGRSEAIRQAIRAGWTNDQVRLERKIDAILTRLNNGVVAVGPSEEVTTPPRRRALDELGL